MIQKRKISQKLRWLNLLIISFLLIWFVFEKLGFLRVKTFKVRTDFNFQKNSQIEKILQNYLGSFLFLIDEKKLAGQIKDTQREIGKVIANKQFPSAVILEIKARQPFLVIPSGNKFFLVDEEGVIFKESREAKNLPMLEEGLQNLQVGSTIEIGKLNLKKILESLKIEEVSKIKVGNNLEIETRTGTLIILPMEASSEKLTALQIILDRFRIEGKRFKKIDLTFQKPVIMQ